MKVWLALGIAMSVSTVSAAYAAPDAAPSAYSDFVVVSVAPRSPSVQPFVMSTPAKERPKQAASLKPAALDAER